MQGQSVPHLEGFNTIDDLVKFYKPQGGYITAGSYEDHYFIVRFPQQKRIHFYAMNLEWNHAFHAHFSSEGYYDEHSPFYVGPEIEKHLKVGYELDGCQVLPEYMEHGIYFGTRHSLENNGDGYLRHFWRVIFPDQTWCRCSDVEAAAEYIGLHLAAHKSQS